MKNKVKKFHPKQGRGVFVGLSGGVDSAVSAALLKKEGYAVTGVFIKAWTPEGYPCTWKEDRRSAMRVAAILDIPFITLDLEKEYKKEVVDYMVAEYKKGRTPNPDVMCNKEIKFGHFLKFGLKNGADFVATGHYAQTSGEVVLMEGADKNKDQSYFLWTLTQKQLKHVLFPVGHLQKSEVRKLALKFGLPQATRKDSQGLCFLGQVDMKEFLGRYISPKKGDVLNRNKEIIGHHNGAIFFTIGERRGFTITKKSDKEVPLYVVAKDIKRNTVTVAPIARKKIAKDNRENAPKIAFQKVLGSPLQGSTRLFSKQFSPQHFFGDTNIKLQNINWVSGKIPDLSKTYSARIRYRQEKQKCIISKQNNYYQVTFEEPQTRVSSGQSLVLYDTRPNGSFGQREICLGGGIINQ